MSLPLMPKATAVWLLDNTTLTFDQISDFCGLHPLEVQAIADGEVAAGMIGLDPILNGQLTEAEIARCAADPKAKLKLSVSDRPEPMLRTKGPRYTPVAKRGEKPDGVAWLIKQYPALTDTQIGRLIGTTKTTIGQIRDRTHWNMAGIKAQNPVLLGLCSQRELDNELAKIKGGAPAPAAPDEMIDSEDAA